MTRLNFCAICKKVKAFKPAAHTQKPANLKSNILGILRRTPEEHLTYLQMGNTALVKPSIFLKHPIYTSENKIFKYVIK